MTTRFITAVAVLVGLTSSAAAQEDTCGLAPHEIDHRQGECSPGTQAPSNDAIIAAADSGSNTRLRATLEYAERVDCASCVPRILRVVFENDDAETREFAAWWLRRRSAAGWMTNMLVNVLGGDYSHRLLPTGVDQETLRARAAEALGEFLVPQAVAPLRTASADDTSATVRQSAVRALGRLNHPESGSAIAAAMADDDAGVRHAALRNVLNVNFFREEAAIVSRLDDSDAVNRREAALLVGQLRTADAVPALSALLMTDGDVSVRRSAAWALGRIGTAEARGALSGASMSEQSTEVQDAIEIAQRMR